MRRIFPRSLDAPMSSWSRYPSGDLGLSESSRRQYGWTKSALGHLSGSCPSLCLSYGVSGGQSLRRQGHGCWPLQSEDQQMSPWEEPEELLLSLAPLAGKWTQLSQYPSSSSSRATLQPLGSSSELWEGCPSKAICPEENPSVDRCFPGIRFLSSHPQGC